MNDTIKWLFGGVGGSALIYLWARNQTTAATAGASQGSSAQGTTSAQQSAALANVTNAHALSLSAAAGNVSMTSLNAMKATAGTASKPVLSPISSQAAGAALGGSGSLSLSNGTPGGTNPSSSTVILPTLPQLR